MKKIIIIAAVICLLLTVGCSSNVDDSIVVDPNARVAKLDQEEQQSSQPEVSDVEAKDDLFFESEGVRIHVYDLAEEILSSLGEPNGTFEAASCAYQGKDMFYYYSGFQLTVNDVDNAEHVTVVMVVDDTVSIPQGVKIGNTEEEMLQLMDDSYDVSGGLYQFISGDTTLQIQIKEGAVASIMYVYTPVNALS